LSSLTPSQRALRARMAAHAMHAQGKTNTTAARGAFLNRFEREVDPDGVLSATERAKRADHARKAYMTRLAYQSARARGLRAAR
jgi:hypothetical protein